jgi:predicted dehydrogenase
VRAQGAPRLPTARRANPEHEQQSLLFSWLALHEEQIPEFKNAFAVPNAARRSPRQGAWMKAEGMRAGVPDVVLAVLRFEDGVSEKGRTHCIVDGEFNNYLRVYGSLYIEMKAPGASPRQSQKDWADRLEAQGMKVIRRCVGWQEAAKHMLEYLGWEEKGMRKKFPELFVS